MLLVEELLQRRSQSAEHQKLRVEISSRVREGETHYVLDDIGAGLITRYDFRAVHFVSIAP
jgi:hypothetical protein